MTDLLPIIFARGQNEGIDPRVAPPDVHFVAKNVRWRKDGRPAKRYGITQISNTGLNGGGRTYTGNPVNAIGAWNGLPILALGSGVRSLLGSTWTDAATANASEISHWSPGRHDPIARADQSSFQNASVGYSTGVLLYVWDDGTSLIFSVRSLTGVPLVAPTTLVNGSFVRCISTTNFIYLLYAPVGSTTLNCLPFDPVALTFGAPVSVGPLNAAGNFYDGQGRGTEFLLVYQSGVSALTVKLFSAIAVPTTTQTQTIAMTAAQVAKMTVAGTTTSSVFVAWVEATSGKVEYATFNNALTVATLTATNVATSATIVDQPGLVIDGNTDAGLFWSGYDATLGPTSFTSTCDISAAGVVSGTKNYFLFRPASKPFTIAAHGTSTNDRYIWVHTHNSDTTNSGKLWDDQRTFYLLRTRQGNVGSARREMHTPGMVGSTGAYTSHLCEVVDTGSGFFTAFTNTVRFGNSAAELYGIDSVSIRHAFESQRFAARDIAQCGRALQLGGGSLYEFNGYTEETDFSNGPVITSITGSGGGGLTPSSNYIYVSVFEWLDSQGRRHRSAPSDPFPFSTTGVNFTATIRTQTLIASSRQALASVHVYRTVAGGSTFHRVTPNVGTSPAFGTGTAVHLDVMTDANAAAQEFVYTDGGVVPNGLCPPHEFMCVNNARLWVGGQLDRNVITASKILVDGEPTQFASFGDSQFSVFLPEDCTGLASIDGTVVAFAREAIYLITGDGPDDQGNGQFNPPQKLPSDTGCIDWRSVLETSIGVFYQSKRGFFLLPRGFNTPLFIGLEVEDTVSQFPICLSATLVSIPSSLTSPGSSSKLGEITARFVMSDAESTVNHCCLVFDLRVMGWSTDRSPNNSPRLGPGGTWGDTFIQSKALSGHFDSIWSESNSTYDDAGSFVGTTITTGDIRPFGVAGYGGFESVVLLGEYRGNANVQIAVRVDGAAQDLYTFAVTSADAPDGSVYLDCTPKTRMGSSISVSVFDDGVTPTEGFIPQALFIEHETIGKTKRLAAARRL